MKLMLPWLLKKILGLVARRVRRRPFRPVRRRSPKIACLIAGGMGDAIMMLPALAFVRKNYPASVIDVFVPPGQAPLLAVLLSPFSVSPLTLSSMAKAMLKRGRYALFFTNTIGTFQMGYECAGRIMSAYAAGFRYPGEAPRDRLYDFSLTVSETRHDIDQNLLLASGAIGIPSEKDDGEYPPAPGPGAASPHKIWSVLVHPGAASGYPCALWPPERYLELITRMTRIGCRVSLLIGPAEEAIYPHFSKTRGITICHTREPKAFVTALREADLFIGNDSGPAHAASLLGIPTITLFGPANPTRTAPRSARGVIIKSSTPCAPCHFTKTDCADNLCMKSISVEQVLEAVERMVRRRK